MTLSEQFYQSEKTGYLNEQFRLFHIKDQTKKEFAYHYHDFHKVVIFISGKATYHIEGKAYNLRPWDILLVDRHAIHRPEIDASVPYEASFSGFRMIFPGRNFWNVSRKQTTAAIIWFVCTLLFQEKLKEILLELESATKSDAFAKDLLAQSLFLQFMIYVNRIFLEKQYIFDRKSYSFDSQIADILQYINHNLKEDLSVDNLAYQVLYQQISSDAKI